jgi:tetratricopeptide (TPR) repeat protein
MRLRLTDADESRLANRGISDVSAWIAAVQARQASLRWTRESIAQAIAILEEALRSSGDIPELYVLLGKTYLYRREAGFDLSEHPLSQARRCVDRAIAADQDGAGAHELQGWLHYSQGQIQQAVVNYKMALSRQGSNPDTLGMLCQCYLLAGQLPVARALIPNVLAMDPLSSVYQLLPAWADVLDGKHASAIASYRALLEREPGSPLFRLFYVWILAINGKADEIETVVGEFPAFDRESLPARISRGFDAACRGIAPETEFSTKDRELATINDMYPRMLAQVYALSNKPDEAIEWLSMAVARGFVNYPYLNENDPILTRLRNFPRYRALLRDVKQRWIDFVA